MKVKQNKTERGPRQARKLALMEQQKGRSI
jgi:hypothetical protein